MLRDVICHIDGHLIAPASTVLSFSKDEPLPAALQAKWLAFEDMIDWESIALVVHRSDMASIPALVAATDAAAMRASILCAPGLLVPRTCQVSFGLLLIRDCMGIAAAAAQPVGTSSYRDHVFDS